MKLSGTTKKRENNNLSNDKSQTKTKLSEIKTKPQNELLEIYYYFTFPVSNYKF